MAGEDNAKDHAPALRRGSKKPLDNGPVGNALRAAYQDAVEERIPSDLLDLLKKLN